MKRTFICPIALMALAPFANAQYYFNNVAGTDNGSNTNNIQRLSGTQIQATLTGDTFTNGEPFALSSLKLFDYAFWIAPSGTSGNAMALTWNNALSEYQGTLNNLAGGPVDVIVTVAPTGDGVLSSTTLGDIRENADGSGNAWANGDFNATWNGGASNPASNMTVPSLTLGGIAPGGTSGQYGAVFDVTFSRDISQDGIFLWTFWNTAGQRPSPTPEPLTIGLGIAGFGLAIRRRIRHKPLAAK